MGKAVRYHALGDPVNRVTLQATPGRNSLTFFRCPCGRASPGDTWPAVGVSNAALDDDGPPRTSTTQCRP